MGHRNPIQLPETDKASFKVDIDHEEGLERKR